ncbi:MAG: (Fe-S)-binding protein [Chloroflexi bacterium]|nr:MAG: (Fe-S)-binding protein [Chloroflexota bacterium]
MRRPSQGVRRAARRRPRLGGTSQGLRRSGARRERQRIRTQPRALLQAIEGVTLVEIADPERCCGSAGVYNLMHPEISRTLQRSKVEAILDVRPDVVVSANPGCMLQIAAGLRDAGSNVRVVHLARFLDDPEAALR